MPDTSENNIPAHAITAFQQNVFMSQGISDKEFRRRMEALEFEEEDQVDHDLKVYPEFFEDVAYGNKPFEIRRDDRNYQVGETLRLREFRSAFHDGPSGYTGRAVIVEVTYKLSWEQFEGLKKGYCALGLKFIDMEG